MSITFTIIPEHRIVFSRFEGTITDADFLEAYRNLYSREDYSPGFNELSDLRTADFSRVTAACLQQIQDLGSMMHQGTGKSWKSALLVAKDLEFGLARMYQSFTDLSDEKCEEVSVFTDEASAIAWLGLPADFLIPSDP